MALGVRQYCCSSEIAQFAPPYFANDPIFWQVSVASMRKHQHQRRKRDEPTRPPPIHISRPRKDSKKERKKMKKLQPAERRAYVKKKKKRRLKGDISAEKRDYIGQEPKKKATR